MGIGDINSVFLPKRVRVCPDFILPFDSSADDLVVFQEPIPKSETPNDQPAPKDAVSNGKEATEEPEGELVHATLGTPPPVHIN